MKRRNASMNPCRLCNRADRGGHHRRKPQRGGLGGLHASQAGVLPDRPCNFFKLGNAYRAPTLVQALRAAGNPLRRRLGRYGRYGGHCFHG